jgi:hypothetical protein
MLDDAARVAAILRADPLRWPVLGMVADLGLPDCWAAAGFVRNAVWDHLHGRAPAPPAGDIDIVWHDSARADAGTDRQIEAALRAAEPSAAWSVKNQARMHCRHGDPPYASVAEAMRAWPETATAVAVRRRGAEDCEVAAPFGLGDLLSLALRPTPRFAGDRRAVFEKRARDKGWLARWPQLRRHDV